MVNYQNGKIYIIRSYKTDYVYIGSTTKKYLSTRLYNHNSKFKLWKKNKTPYMTAFKIIEYGDAYIELIQNFPCNSKDELTKCEGEYIRNTKNCINKCMKFGGSTKEWQKQYYEENKEEIKEYKKQYREENKEELNKKQREYYEKNKEELNKKKRENKVQCECGVLISKVNLYRHIKTKKHSVKMNILVK